MEGGKRYFQRLAASIQNRDDPVLKYERDRLAEENASIKADRSLIAIERDRLAEENASIKADRSLIAIERDRLAEENASIKADGSLIAIERDRLAEENASIKADRSLIASERDRLAEENARIAADYSLIASERDRLNLQLDKFVFQASRHAAVESERDQLMAKLGSLAAGQQAETAAFSAMEKARSLYLDLMEKTLVGSIDKDPPTTTFGKDEYNPQVRFRGLDWPKNALSMIGSARMQNFRRLIERAIAMGVRGDIVETGVWRGGASIMARAVLSAYDVKDRLVVLADSFEGLPPGDPERYPADQGSNFHEFPELAVSMEEVRRNFERFGLLDDQVVFIKGWFKDTMPTFPDRPIAILRLDGDMYESTIDPLTYLFDRVSSGGWIIVDDYEWVPACKAAVTDFLCQRGLHPDITPIDGVGVFFQKQESKPER